MTIAVPKTNLMDTSTVDLRISLNIALDDASWDVQDWQPTGWTIRPQSLVVLISPVPHGETWRITHVNLFGPRVLKTKLGATPKAVQYFDPFDDDVLEYQRMPEWVEIIVRREFARFLDEKTGPAPDSLEARVARLETAVGIKQPQPPVEEAPVGPLPNLAAQFSPRMKLRLLEAMGFQPVGSDHDPDCAGDSSSGISCQCVPPATQWSQPDDVDKLRNETWADRVALAHKWTAEGSHGRTKEGE